MKKLKLDTLSSNEITTREANQIKGGQPICLCYCYCDTLEQRYSERSFDSNDIYQFHVQ